MVKKWIKMLWQLSLKFEPDFQGKISDHKIK